MDYNTYVIIPNQNITHIYGKTKYVSIISLSCKIIKATGPSGPLVYSYA